MIRTDVLRGKIAENGMSQSSFAVKIGVIALMIIVTNPIGAHTVAKGAYKAGIRPEKEMVIDKYGEDLEEK